MRDLAAQRAFQGSRRPQYRLIISNNGVNSSLSNSSNRQAHGTNPEHIAQHLAAMPRARRYGVQAAGCISPRCADSVVIVPSNDATIRYICASAPQRRPSSTTAKTLWLRGCGPEAERTELSVCSICTELATAATVESKLCAPSTAGRLSRIQ